MSAVSWNDYPSYDNSDIVDYHITGTSDTYIYDISNLVSRWHEGEQPNYGLTLMDIEGSGGTNSVKSLEYTGTTYDPVVEIGYIDPTGLKDYWSYSSYDSGTAGTAYISSIVLNPFKKTQIGGKIQTKDKRTSIKPIIRYITLYFRCFRSNPFNSPV